MNVIIVGGGIAGIVSSLILASKGIKVYLIEKEEQCGGLLSSYTNGDGICFDYGTHIPCETNIKVLDELLFNEISREQWNFIDILKVGNFFEGVLYRNNQAINVMDLPVDLYNKGLADFINTQPIEGTVENLKDYTEKYYGSTFSQAIFAPLMRKLLGCELKELHPYAHHLFGYGRLIVGNDHTSRALKGSSFFEGKLSYASYNEGFSKVMKFYPKFQAGGMGSWISILLNKAKVMGVDILTQTTVESLECENSKVKKVILTNNRVIECEHLIWTTAPFALQKLINLNLEVEIPEFRFMSVHHYIMDRPFLTDNHYIYCNDPEMDSFRVTLYPNIQSEGEQHAPFKCTVEVLAEKDINLQELHQQIRKELLAMRLIDGATNTTFSHYQAIKNGFPVMTNKFVRQNKQINSNIEANLLNVSLLGKGNGNDFFMNDVLISAYEQISKLTRHWEGIYGQQ